MHWMVVHSPRSSSSSWKCCWQAWLFLIGSSLFHSFFYFTSPFHTLTQILINGKFLRLTFGSYWLVCVQWPPPPSPSSGDSERKSEQKTRALIEKKGESNWSLTVAAAAAAAVQKMKIMNEWKKKKTNCYLLHFVERWTTRDSIHQAHLQCVQLLMLSMMMMSSAVEQIIVSRHSSSTGECTVRQPTLMARYSMIFMDGMR